MQNVLIPRALASIQALLCPPDLFDVCGNQSSPLVENHFYYHPLTVPMAFIMSMVSQQCSLAKFPLPGLCLTYLSLCCCQPWVPVPSHLVTWLSLTHPLFISELFLGDPIPSFGTLFRLNL